MKKGLKKSVKKVVRTSVELDQDVYNKLSNFSDITEISHKGIFNQALRKFLGMTTPTIKEGEN